MLAFNQNINATVSLLIILIGYHLANIKSTNLYQKKPTPLQQQVKVADWFSFCAMGDWGTPGFSKDQRSSQ